RVERGAGGEIDLDVDQGQRAAFDEMHAGAGRRGPVLDLGRGERRGGERGEAEAECGQTSELDDAGDGRCALASTRSVGRRREGVRREIARRDDGGDDGGGG